MGVLPGFGAYGHSEGKLHLLLPCLACVALIPPSYAFSPLLLGSKSPVTPTCSVSWVREGLGWLWQTSPRTLRRSLSSPTSHTLRSRKPLGLVCLSLVAFLPFKTLGPPTWMVVFSASTVVLGVLALLPQSVPRWWKPTPPSACPAPASLRMCRVGG